MSLSCVLELPSLNKNMAFFWRGRFSCITFTAVLIQSLLNYKDIALVNTLTANYEYSRNNTDDLPLPVQMQLSGKLKTFS